MRLPSTNRIEGIPVLTAGISPLTAYGIETVLKGRRGIRALPWRGDPAGRPHPISARLVLVLDQAAIPSATPEYLRSLNSKFPNARILIIGNQCPRDEVCRLLLLGARGFIAYDDAQKSLAEAIEAVWAGGLWVDPRLLAGPARGATQGAHEGAEVPLGVFTPREQLVVELLQQRLCDKEISARLNISQATVKFHLKNIYNKLGLHDRHLVAERAALSPHPRVLAS